MEIITIYKRKDYTGTEEHLEHEFQSELLGTPMSTQIDKYACNAGIEHLYSIFI